MDDQLSPALEEVEQAHLAVGTLEAILALDLDHRHPEPLRVHHVAGARHLLLLSQQLPARDEPLFAQELSPLDEAFRRQFLGAFALWTDAFAGALDRGQIQGAVRRDVDSREVATFLIASVEGSFGLAKNARRAEIVGSNLAILCGYLDGLRVSDPVSRPAKRSTRRRSTAR